MIACRLDKIGGVATTTDGRSSAVHGNLSHAAEARDMDRIIALAQITEYQETELPN